VLNVKPGVKIAKKSDHRYETATVKREEILIDTFVYWKTTKIWSICSAKFSPNELNTCRKNIESVFHNKEEINQMYQNNGCKVGKTCGENECNGEDVKYCERAVLNKFSNNRIHVDSLPSDVKFFKTNCEIYWDCETLSGVVEFAFKDDSTVEIVDIYNNKVNLDINDNTHFQNNIAYYYKIKRRVEELIITCFSSNLGSLCHDKENENIFLQSNNVFYDHYKYSFENVEMSIHAIETPDFLGSTATMKDLNKLYKHVEFENIKENYNLNLISKQLERVEHVLLSMLLYNMNITNHPLQQLMKSKIKHKFEDGILEITPCFDKKLETNFLEFKQIVGGYLLFPIMNLSFIEFSEINFTLNYDQRKFVIDSINKGFSDLPVSKSESNDPSSIDILSNFWEIVRPFYVVVGSTFGLVFGLKSLFWRKL